MISASEEFIAALESNHSFLCYLECVLADGTTLSLDNSDLLINSLAVEKASSNSESFDVGSFIVGKLSFTLNNTTGNFTGYDFNGAVVTLSIGLGYTGYFYPATLLYPSIKLYPNLAVTETVQIGVYTVVRADSTGAWIGITAYDNAFKFQNDFTGVTYPIAAADLITAVATDCGVSVTSLASQLSDISITSLPDGYTPNSLQVVAWASFLGGCNAFITPSGTLEVKWYDASSLSATWRSIERYGWDGADLSLANEITAIMDCSVMSEDIMVDNIGISYSDDEGIDTTYMTAHPVETGYRLVFSDNPFLTTSNIVSVAGNVDSSVYGMKFRPFNISALNNPLYEPGDIVWFSDRKGKRYLSILTGIEFAIGQRMSLSCGAAEPERQAASEYSATKRSIQQTKRIAKNAAKIAGNTNQYFWHTSTGTDTGAHITEVPQDEFLADPDNGGGNLLARSNGVAVRDGLKELGVFSADGLRVYSNTDTPVEIAHLGYGEGNASTTRETDYAPYYTLGVRRDEDSCGNYSTSMGYNCDANGYASFAGGEDSRANADARRSFAWGHGVHTEYDNQFAVGYNNSPSHDDYIFMVGNGSSSSAPSNAFAVTSAGEMMGRFLRLQESPFTSYSAGDHTLSDNTNETLTSLSIDSDNYGGYYLFIGVATFAANPTGYRRLHFSFSDGGTAVNRYGRISLPAGDTPTMMQVVWARHIPYGSHMVEVYLVGNQTSGASLGVSDIGITAIRIG